jgi:hypothetical protein
MDEKESELRDELLKKYQDSLIEHGLAGRCKCGNFVRCPRERSYSVHGLCEQCAVKLDNLSREAKLFEKTCGWTIAGYVFDDGLLTAVRFLDGDGNMRTLSMVLGEFDAKE